MTDQVIDLTLSDDETRSKSMATAPVPDKPPSVPRRSSRNRQPKPESQNVGGSEGDSQRNEPSKGSSRKSKSEKGGEPNEEPASRTSNGSLSLLSRIGEVVQANERDNKSKRAPRDRPTREKGKEKEKEHPVTQEPQVSLTNSHRRWSRSRSPNPPKELPLSELPVDQLFFIDTGPAAQGNESGTEIPTPLDTEASTPNDANETSTRALKRKQAKERKKERKLEASSGNTPDDGNIVEFVGGDALAVGDTVVSTGTTHTAAEITPSTTTVTDSARVDIAKQAAGGATEVASLALPAHVTLWTEGDPDVSLADVSAGALEPEEGVEYLDYEGDQVTGIARYFIPESGTTVKKLCRTCGEEGHIAKFCNRLICLTCGERDDHGTRNCPMRVVCFNCGGKGHVISTCPQPRGQHGCDRCGSSSHILQRCPEQFKTYIYLSDSERLQVLEERAKLEKLSLGEGGEGHIARHIWCYNCGCAGHWGDDCRESRPYGAPKDPCAFGSHNASRGPFGDTGDVLVGNQDAPRPVWMDDDPHLQNVGRRGKEANMKRNRAVEASAQDRNEDDWFSRAAGSSSNQRRPTTNDHTSRSNPPSKPKISFQPRDNGSYQPGGRDIIRDRNRDRGRDRDQDRDRDRRKRSRDYEDEERNHRRKDRDSDSRRKADSRDDDRRHWRPHGGDRRSNGDRRGPQYRGSYA